MLRNVPFFQHLSVAQLGELEQIGRSESREAGSVVFTEGEKAGSLYVILHGRVAITRHEHEDSRPIELSRLGPGDFFGELALFDGAPRSASAKTLEPTELFVLGREAFLEFLAQSPGMISELVSGVSSKIRGVNEKFLVQILEKERVRAEMERERYRSLAQLVAGVAHEINTPLGIVNTAASIIAESLSDERTTRLRADPATAAVIGDIEEAASLIQGNLARANKLVQSFKNLSVAQVIERREEVSLVAVIEEIVTLFGPQAKRANVDVMIVAPDQPLQWIGYPGYLGQIVLNFLSNIERYAYPDGAGGKAEITLEDAGEAGYRIVVRDWGAGIAPDDLARVFEPFFTTGRARGGTGLGMAIVHNLVTTALHGTIAIDSAPGKGTTLTLTLPREVPENE